MDLKKIFFPPGFAVDSTIVVPFFYPE